MHQLSTDDLRLLAEVVLNKTDFEPLEHGLDRNYLIDVREGLLDMANKLDQTGEFYIESREEGDCGCDHGHEEHPNEIRNSQ